LTSKPNIRTPLGDAVRAAAVVGGTHTNDYPWVTELISDDGGDCVVAQMALLMIVVVTILVIMMM
jgi:hypothetical protein